MSSVEFAGIQVVAEFTYYSAFSENIGVGEGIAEFRRESVIGRTSTEDALTWFWAGFRCYTASFAH